MNSSFVLTSFILPFTNRHVTVSMVGYVINQENVSVQMDLQVISARLLVLKDFGDTNAQSSAVVKMTPNVTQVCT